MSFKPFQLGKYEFVEFLGRGGMAEVYRVRLAGDHGFEKEFAVKRVLPSFLTDPSIIRMFKEEARLTSVLNHANIVHVFDFIESTGNFFLVMEFIHGKNLSMVLHSLERENKTIPHDIALYIINEVCKGLDYAHHKKDTKTGQLLNIVHRDISPQNIMLSHEGGVKIVDFGIAKAISSNNNTRTGIAAGKAAYMSPEQAMGKKLDPRSDLFSLCLLLYELLTHKRLFDGPNDLATIRLVQDCKLPDIETEMAGFPESIPQLLIKGLGATPELRFENAGTMQAAIQRALNKHFPDMNQGRFAAWLHENSVLIFSEESDANEYDPLSISQQRFMEDGFNRLEEAFLQETRPPERSKENNLSSLSGKNRLLLPKKNRLPSTFLNLLALSGIFLFTFGIIYKFSGPSPRTLPAPAPLAQERTLTPEQRSIATEAPKSNNPKPPTEMKALPPSPPAPLSPSPQPAAIQKEGLPSVKENTSAKPLEKSPVVLLPSHQVTPLPEKKDKIQKRIAAQHPLKRETTKKENKLFVKEEKEGLTATKKLAPSHLKLPVFPPEKLPITVSANDRNPAVKVPPTPSDPSPIEDPETENEFESLSAPQPSTNNETPSQKAKQLYEEGMVLFNNGLFGQAAARFHKSRTLKPTYLPSWFFEIKSLEASGQIAEAEKIAQEISRLRPESRKNPLIKPYLR